MRLRKLFKERSNKSESLREDDGKHKKSERFEESLREIQGRYRKLLNHTQAIQYTHDLRGQFLSVDQEITEFLGYERNSLLNMDLRTILASEVRHKFETYLDEIKRQGVSKGLMVVQTASGEKRILKYYNTLRTEDVPTPFVQGIAYDVTEQKQTKKTLKQLSEQLSIILKSLPVVCYISKAEEDYGITYITHNVKAITGFEQTDFTSKSSFWANRIHPEDAPKIFADLPQIFEKGFHEHRYRWQVADGSYKWFYDYTRLIKSSDGKNYLIGMMQDITERKRAEEALLNAAQQWRTTFDGINDLVSLLDLDGKILRCNKAMKDFVGKPFNEIINHSCWEIILGTTTPIENCPFLRMRETLHRETTTLSANGLWFDISVDPIFDQAGRLIGAVNILSDITKHKQADEAVTKLSQENAVMAEIGRIINSSLDIEEVYGRFAGEVLKLIPFDRIEIAMINRQEDIVTIAYIMGIGVPGRDAGDTFPMTGSVVEDISRTRSSQLIQSHNVEEFTTRFPRLTSSFQAGLRSMIFVPLISEDQVIGVLSLRTTRPDAYTEKDLRLAERVGNQIAGAIANAQLFAERKRAEENVRRNEEKLQALMDASPMAISWADVKGNIEYNNRKFRELFGYTVEDIPTIAEWRRLAYPDPAYRGTVSPLVGTLTEAQKQGRGVTPIELTITCKDGSTRYVEQMGAFASNRILAIYKDITERKLAEEALRQSEEKYRTILENMEDGYFEVDLAGDFTFVNDAQCRSLGYTKQELIGMNNRQCTDPTTSEKLYQTFNGVYRTGEPVKVLDVEVIRKGGTKADHQISVSLMRDSEGIPIGFRGITRDVTERKQADEAVKRLSQENAVMAEIGRIISSTLNIEEVYERFAEEVRKLIPSDRITLSSINPDGRSVIITYVSGPDVKNRNRGDVFPLKGTLVEMASIRRSGILILMENEEAVARTHPTLLNTFRTGFRSLMSVPLISKDQVIGVLILHTSKENAFTGLDLKLAERVGNQIAGAIANAQLFTERKRAEEAAARLAQESAVMAEIGRVISSTLNIEEVYERFAEEVRKLIPFDRIAVNTINLKDRSGSVAYAWGVEIPHRKQGEVFPLADSLSKEIITTRSGILIQKADENELAERYPGFLGIRAGFRSMISVPLVSKDEVIGVLHLRSFKANAYTESDLKLAERVGNQIAGAIANAQLYAQRKQMEDALRKSEERFRELFDYAPLGYHEYDAEGRITSVNRTDFEMLGYTAEEMIGQPIWKFNVEGDVLRDQVLAKLAGTSPPGRNLERTYRKKDGSPLPVLVEDRLIFDQNGRIKGIRSTIQDITERKRAEQEKESLREQLRQSQKMEAIGKLAGGVAHDFNNLLTVIHGYSELMLNNLDQGSRLRQDVQEILNASERASSLTRQLLAFSRKQVLQPKVLDLDAHVSNMDKMLRRMIGEDIELVTLLTKDLGRIKADPGQIEQVILNLAVNAKDAMLTGGKLTIETANVTLDETYACSRIGVTPGDYVMLSMSDTGVGMAPETKERIFEPFFTTKEKGKGTGLGLSTVYGIVQQSGGNIWVYSEPGLGTTFKIYLPRIEEGTESLRPEAVSTKPLQGYETVLLVEDEEMVRKLACTVLEKNGYTVLEASNGDEALDVFQGRNGNPIHLVVTDVVMPGMSGRQLADRLVALRPELKVLYMSGYTDNAIVHHGVLDPGIAYIQKPFTPDALASKVREILDGN